MVVCGKLNIVLILKGDSFPYKMVRILILPSFWMLLQIFFLKIIV